MSVYSTEKVESNKKRKNIVSSISNSAFFAATTFFLLLSCAVVALPIPAAAAIDGTLYASGLCDTFSNVIQRFHASNGVFVDNLGIGGSAVALTIGPDDNLYVGFFTGVLTASMASPAPLWATLYNKQTVAGNAIEQILVFGSNPPLPQQHFDLTVNSVDLSGSALPGLWTTIRGIDGLVLKAGFTPITFTGESHTSYKMTVASYDGKAH